MSSFSPACVPQLQTNWFLLLASHQYEFTEQRKHCSAGVVSSPSLGGNFPNSEKVIPDHVMSIFLAWRHYHIALWEVQPFQSLPHLREYRKSQKSQHQLSTMPKSIKSDFLCSYVSLLSVWKVLKVFMQRLHRSRLLSQFSSGDVSSWFWSKMLYHLFWSISKMNMNKMPPLLSPSTLWFQDVKAGKSQSVNTCERLDILLLISPSAKQPLLFHPVFNVLRQNSDCQMKSPSTVWTWSLRHFCVRSGEMKAFFVTYSL